MVKLTFSASFFALSLTLFEYSPDDVPADYSSEETEWHTGNSSADLSPAPALDSWDEAGDRAIDFRPPLQ